MARIRTNCASTAKNRRNSTTINISLKSNNEKISYLNSAKTQDKLRIALEQEKSTEDILKRTTITAPLDGTIIGLAEHHDWRCSKTRPNHYGISPLP